MQGVENKGWSAGGPPEEREKVVRSVGRGSRGAGWRKKMRMRKKQKTMKGEEEKKDRDSKTEGGTDLEGEVRGGGQQRG